MVLNPIPGDSAWLEFKNGELFDFDLANFKVVVHQTKDTLEIPSKTIIRGGYATIDVSELTSGNGESANPTLIKGLLYLIQNNIKVDSITIPEVMLNRESFGRYPENTFNFQFFQSENITKGHKNSHGSAWAKITNAAAFSPRDQSANGIVHYQDKVWIFAGFSYYSLSNTWYSTSNIWKSADMLNWEQVNGNPPYHPYSAFIVFKDQLWAFDGNCWSSSDGVTWEKRAENAYPGTVASRVVVKNDTLWFAKAKSVGYSTDGIHWFYSTPGNAPWQSRDWPGFVSFKNKLWYFGGGENYLSPDETYHNDVYVSEDGVNWDLVTEHAEWEGRYWFSYNVFDEKIWLLGGWDGLNKDNDEFGNLNDVWYTSDGTKWEQLSEEGAWPNRHSQFSIALDSCIYVSSGYGHGGQSRMYNDVWKYTGKSPYQFNVSGNLNGVYGDTLLISGLNQEIQIDLTVDEDIVVLSNSGLKLKETGRLPIKLTSHNTKNYYSNDTLLFVDVGKRLLNASVRNTSKPFASDNPDFILELNGFVDDDDETSLSEIPSVRTIATKFSPVGEYPLIAFGGLDDHYTFDFKDGVMLIEPGEPAAVFPSPVNNFLNIFIGDLPPGIVYTAKFFSSSGRLFREEPIKADTPMPLDVTDLPRGVVYVRVEGNGHLLSTYRILKL